MKRRDFIQELTDVGCHMSRHGRKHDIFVNPKNGRKATVPRHSEIKKTRSVSSSESSSD